MKIWQLFMLLLASQLTLASDLRIVSADASATQILLAMGQGKHLVGVDSSSVLSQPYQSIPDVGYHRQLSAEGLLSLKPTLVIGSEVMGPPAVLNALQKANVNVLKLKQAKTLDEYRSNIELLKNVINCGDCADNLIVNLKDKFHQANRQTKSIKRYVFLMTMDGKQLRMAGRNTGGNALIELLQGKNQAHYEGYRNLSLEGLLAINPDVILLTSSQPEEQVIQQFKKQFPLLSRKTLVNVDANAVISGVSITMLDEVLRISEQIHGS